VRYLVSFFAAGVLLTGGTAAAAAPATGAGAFIKTVVSQIVRNDYEHAWLSLHPAQQQLVSQADYVRCELQSPVSGRLVWVKVARVANARFRVGGLAGRVTGKAVTVRIRLADDSIGVSFTVTHTAHAVAVAGRWRWILPPERIGIYSTGGCA
jgi:hypothetical protein